MSCRKTGSTETAAAKAGFGMSTGHRPKDQEGPAAAFAERETVRAEAVGTAWGRGTSGQHTGPPQKRGWNFLRGAPAHP